MRNLWISLSLLLIIISGQVFAQFSDDFSDGDFSSNPTWSGDASEFEVDTAFQLHLNAPAATAESHLVTTSTAINNAVWEFEVFLDFNPSSSNQAYVYLVSDQADLEGSLNGYYVRIGNTNDEVSLYRQSGSTSTVIIDGQDDKLDTDPVFVRVRVTRDALGNWELFSDTSAAGTGFVSEGTAFDDTHTTSAYFGVNCDYTSTRSDLFYFDNFNVTGVGIIDTFAPILDALTVISNTELDLDFNEAVLPSVAQNNATYSVNNGIGFPSSAFVDGTDPSLVHLTFSSAFSNGTMNTITISNIEDLNSNIEPTISTDFIYFMADTPQPGEILINEIFADPSPSFGLPADEFVELYNPTSNFFDLDGFQFSDGSNTVTLSSQVLAPNGYVILCPTGAVADYGTYGTTLGVSSFPSLNNTGDDVKIARPDGTVLDRVNYDLSWYQDAFKDDGGFTLERINPNNPCPGSANWIASNALIGGTPGAINSVTGLAPDTSAPEIIAINILSANQIEVIVSEALDSVSAASTGIYSIDNGIGNPTAVNVQSPGWSSVILDLPQNLDSNTVYTLTISNLIDCLGNASGSIDAIFAIPRAAELFDILITEIMAAPAPVVGLPDAEYVELYNASNKAINLGNLVFADASSNEPLPDYLLMPGTYVIIADDADANLFGINNVAPVGSLPSLNNTEDELKILTSNGEIIHYVFYSDSWYQDALKENGGYSLEMIDLSNPCLGAVNWRASNDPSGGTPGAENSVNGSTTDDVAPGLVKAYVIDSQLVQITFNEVIDPDLILDPGLYFIDNGIGEPDSVFVELPLLNTVNLIISPALQNGQIYELTVSGMTDCAGNSIGLDNTIRFGLPEAVEVGDLLINEVLFNPATGGSDYVEIYNYSDKIIDLLEVWIANRDEDTDSLDQVEFITEEGCLILPGDYMAFTENRDIVLQQYFTPNPEGVIEVADLPSLDNDEGTVVLLQRLGTILDELHYLDDWHIALLDDEDGVSLERLSFDQATQNESNWQSAAQTAGFGTPAYQNSLYTETPTLEDDITIEPGVFSPDGDGYNDILNIYFNFGAAGYIANVWIYDDQGREITQLVSNESVALEGYYTWDGIKNDGSKARIGIYIIYFEIFDLEGNISKFKKTAVLAGRLD